MLRRPAEHSRELKCVRIDANLVVLGGGLSGVCCAVTAARAGLRVALVQDRPVLGGNASSEVRLWVLGATSHMGNNNRWAREGGVIDEILVENTFRNPEGNPLVFDTVVLEKVASEPNITLLLNTAVLEVSKHDDDPDTIATVRGFCSQNSTVYELAAPLFCDASGDGVIGFLAGAAFRMGAESAEEFDERFAPSVEYGQLLGHSMYFYSKDVGRPVKFTPPSFALRDITKIPRYRQFNAQQFGCQLWWIEYGGRLDTVHDTEAIKWELWRVVYGVWDYIKNSGRFPEAENLTLEWVGTVPGKRESRRFEGGYMLSQRDVIEQRRHDDAVSFGGWAIDLHPADGVFSEKPGCNQWHAKGVYQIPYRCMFSRNVRNLFLAGRIISATHVAFGSSRVMATCAHGGQAVGLAAALCKAHGCHPADLLDATRMAQLQRDLLRAGQFIPHVQLHDGEDLAQRATVTASSTLALDELPSDGPWVALDVGRAMLLPLRAGPLPAVTFTMQSDSVCTVEAQLRVCSRLGSYTPDQVLTRATAEVGSRAAVRLNAGAADGDRHLQAEVTGAEQAVTFRFDADLPADQYAFVCLMPSPGVRVRCSGQRLTGVLALAHAVEARVASSAVQDPPGDIGVDRFEFWLPRRRPGGHNLAVQLDPPLRAFEPANTTNGYARPFITANAWLADPSDPAPTLTLRWEDRRLIRRVVVVFDADSDHPMESVLMGHPEREMPFCVRGCTLLDDSGRVLASLSDNHLARWEVTLVEAAATRELRVRCEPPAGLPAAVFEVRCYE